MFMILEQSHNQETDEIKIESFQILESDDFNSVNDYFKTKEYETITDGFSTVWFKEKTDIYFYGFFKKLLFQNIETEQRYCLIASRKFEYFLPEIRLLRVWNVKDEFDFYENREKIITKILIDSGELSPFYPSSKLTFNSREKDGIFIVKISSPDKTNVLTCYGFRIES